MCIDYPMRCTPLLLLLTLSAACAQTPPPATQPQTQPATQSADAHPTEGDADGTRLTPLDRELAAIEAAANEIQHLQATLRYDRVQGLLGSREVRMGTLQYDAGSSDPDAEATPARFRLHLDRLFVNGRPREQDRSYIYDGHWMAERLDDQRIFIRREVTPQAEPALTGGSPASTRDPLKLGEGPFPLPLNMDREELQTRFHIEIIDDEPSGDDESTDPLHLRLTPREGFRSESAQIDIWYDRDSHLPQRVEAIDDFESQNRSTFILTNPDLKPEFDEATFDTSPPEQGDWDIQIIHLEDR